MKRWIFFTFILQVLAMTPAHALIPIESIILGNFSEEYKNELSDPLDYIFKIDTKEDEEKLSDYREYLSLYRGFYEEGIGLDNRCKERPSALYGKPYEKDRVTRSVIANLQYIGLDLMTRAIPEYAKYFEFTEQEYSNLVEKMVGNWCSQNITIISLKSLKDNFKAKYNSEERFQLPTLGKNPLFPDSLSKFVPEDKAREREFKQTLDLFKAFCSWGGDIKDTRLLVPLLRNPQVMAFVIRQMAGIKLNWNKLDQGFTYADDPKTIRVHCKNLICRRLNPAKFKAEVPRTVGSKGFHDDFQRIYCENLRDIDYVLNGQVPKIKRVIKNVTFDDQNLMVAQMISLLTGVPDFMVRSEKYSDGQEWLRASVDRIWDQWADKQSQKFGKDLLFEESLTLELVDTPLYFNRYQKNFAVVFDVNLGEFDRINQMVGKISTKFDIKISKGFLNWMRKQLLNDDDNFLEVKEKAHQRFKSIVADFVEEARFKFSIPPWKGDLEELIVREVSSQLLRIRGKLYEVDDRGMVNIPVVFNYGPFALKYIRYQHKVNKNQENIKKTLEFFQNQRASKAALGQ
ncbi:MAG: hypothetical protein EP319_02190 [Deltaproteobacteria bacterium]|nr:MAG: hypothetical protein EP319_02190 [Deltaproteobacteria bacterium]